MWHKRLLNVQNIDFRTEKSVLIKLESTSDMAGYSFWFPRKLLRKTINDWYYTFSFADDFTFKLSNKNGGEITITSEQMLNYFSDFNEQAGKGFVDVSEPEPFVAEVGIKDELINR